MHFTNYLRRFYLRPWFFCSLFLNFFKTKCILLIFQFLKFIYLQFVIILHALRKLFMRRDRCNLFATYITDFNLDMILIHYNILILMNLLILIRRLLLQSFNFAFCTLIYWNTAILKWIITIYFFIFWKVDLLTILIGLA